MKKISIGFSPCPNDTFIFDALIHGKIDTGGYTFEPLYADVETLNQMALRAELEVTKLSFHAFAHCVEHYEILDAGSALGFGVGPLIISREPLNRKNLENPQLRIAIPGKLTTANFLFSTAFPHLQNKQELVFSAIEEAVLNGEADLGVIIHENRFTYQDKGLHKVLDLGAYWEDLTGGPIPLGGIMVRRTLDPQVKEDINLLLRQSVEFAFANPRSGLEYIRSHAQTMSEEVMYQHIDLYVNAYSIELGKTGKAAISDLFNRAVSAGIIPPSAHNLFLT